MWFERPELTSIKAAARQFPAVVLTGARQVGKTALLAHVFPEASVVSLDLPSAADAAEHSPDTFLAALPEPVIIDEVQYAPMLFRHLKARIDRDRHRMGRFLMTGSQRFVLMQSVSESLAGRAAILELGPLSAADVRATVPATSTFELVWRGGYPELWRMPELSPQLFFAGYVATYLERDVRNLLRVTALRDFERFIRACAVRSGQLVNLADMARDVGIAQPTAREWLSVLETSGIVAITEPWFTNLGKRMVKTPKLYFRDSGLLCFLLGISRPEALATAPQAGAIWETFVLAQLLSLRALHPAAKIFFYRDAHGAEVDFVVEHDGRATLVEAKWTEHVDARDAAGIEKLLPALGELAAAEHWIICRTPQRHRLADAPVLVGSERDVAAIVR